ncbi:uncharacterized protein LOC143424185 [Xylocopa sonorina]|uniref:uncharacterized protein LOC143424185 n=1 Tax=Xylocopa sonorina TaxID=1818115 RepID=UPI00403AD236
MDTTDTKLKRTSDVEQMALIGKMHNLQWLKSNSQLPSHTKTLPDKKEVTDDTLESKINEGTNEKQEIDSTDNVSNSPALDTIDSVLNKNIYEDDNIVNKDTHQTSLNTVDLPEKSMETVWNDDVDATDTLYSSPTPVVVQKLDDQEMISMSLAENIVTVQLKQFRLDENEKDTSEELHNEADNEWNNIHHNMSDLSKSDNDINNQVSSKQCHDNNNNNAKSKSQSPVETKKCVQKTTAKLSTKKASDQKIKKSGGSSLKESCTPLKQDSKSNDVLVNLSNEDTVTSTSNRFRLFRTTDSKQIVGMTSRMFIDIYDKDNASNKNVTMGKGTRTKEQQFFKQQFSTFHDSGNKSRSSTEGLEEKTKSVTTKLKPIKSETDRKSNEIVDDIRKCHKFQAMRTQSHNVQYNRNKPLIKSQQRYSKNAIKSEEDGFTHNSSGLNNNNNNINNNNNSMSNSTENVSKRKYESQQSVITKQISDTQSNQNTSGKNIKNSNVPGYSISEKNSTKSSSVPCKRNYHNVSNARNSTERNFKDDQAYTQKFRKDSNIYRRSSGILQTFFRDSNGKAKTDDHKKNVTDNNLTKDYRVSHSPVDSKVRSESEGSKVTVYPPKTSNGASNTNKTDTLESITVNNVQSVKSLKPFPSSTKDFTSINTSTHTPQESQVLQASCNETEVQFVKTEQEDISNNNNNSNNKMSASNSETKSVKFSDNVQEFNVAHHSITPYSDNFAHQNKLSASSFYSDLQIASNASNAQQMENHQNVQNKNYFDNNNAQYSNTAITVQNNERDLHLMDMVHQKSEQTSHVLSPQAGLSHNNCNSAIPMGNAYQNMSNIYLNQYNNAQTIPRKTADSTIITENVLIPSTSSYTVDNQNVVQSDASNNILMHNTQTSVLPPPGFHNHPIATQQNQWNMSVPNMVLFGNMINPAHPLNVPVQNFRHVCNMDYNNVQQTGYLQHPFFFVPPLCMQNWNPLLQYPPPLFQNSAHTDCNTYPNHVLPANNPLPDTVNCPVPTSLQNNPYKHFQQMQPLENTSNFSVPVKLDNYIGNMQNCKPNIGRMKDNNMDAHMRANQYRAPVPNEYQNCSQDTTQVMIPFSYAVTMDSIARVGPSNMHVQMNQKYTPRAQPTASYPRTAECPIFHSNSDPNNRKDDVSKSDTECVPPIISPKECMYYGVNYPRKTDNIQNPSVRPDMKSVPYVHSNINTQHYAPQYQRNAAYYAPSKELSSRVNVRRGLRKTMDQ